MNFSKFNLGKHRDATGNPRNLMLYYYFDLKKKFQIEFKSEIKYSQKFPKPKTWGIGVSFPDLREMTNCNSPIHQIPKE